LLVDSSRTVIAAEKQRTLKRWVYRVYPHECTNENVSLRVSGRLHTNTSL
jgi:hypothetical protein